MKRLTVLFLIVLMLAGLSSCNIISNLLGSSDEDQTVQISGTISLPSNAPSGGFIYLGILSTPSFLPNSSVQAWYKYQQLDIAPGTSLGYTFSNVIPGKYILGTFLDINGNLVYDEGEPAGAYPAPTGAILYDFNSNMASANITMTYAGGGSGITDTESVNLDKAALVIGFATGDSATTVTQNLSLTTSGSNGSTIFWTSTNESVVLPTGSVIRPATDTQVTLIATISKGTISSSKLFSLTILADQITDADAVAADRIALEIGYSAGDTASAVTSNLLLPTIGENGSTIVWFSGNTGVVSTNGVVSRPATATNVTLTAFIDKGDASAIKSFLITILATTLTDAQTVSSDAGTLQIGYSAGDSSDAVTGKLSLPTAGANGSYISWVSSLPAMVATSGIVTRPTTDTAVDLTATISFGVASQVKIFNLIILSSELSDAQSVAVDKAGLAITFAPGDTASGVTANLGLPTAGANETTITWSSSNTFIISSSGLVTRPAATSVVALTATLSKGDVSDIKVFSLTVLQAELSDAAIVAADLSALTIGFAAGDSASSVTKDLVLRTSGTNGSTITWNSSVSDSIDVTTISGTGAVTRQDTNKTVNLSATVSKNETSSIKIFTVVVIARALTDSEVVAVDQAALEIGFADGDTATGVTNNLFLPVIGMKGSTITWVSSNPSVTPSGAVERPLETSLTVTLTATLVKNSASNTKTFTITVLSRTMTDAEKVAADKSAIKIGFVAGDSATSVTMDLTLPTTGVNGSTITWASDAPAVVSSTGTVVRPSTQTTVTLTATITNGSASDSKSFPVDVIRAVPATPSGLLASNATSTSLALSWSAVVGADSYQLLRNGTQVYNGSTLAFTNTNLAVGTSYSYSVKATNTSGSSGLSLAVSGTTLKPVPLNLITFAPTETSLSISWTAAAGSVGYEVYRDESETGSFAAKAYTGTSTAFIDRDLNSSTNYYYKVKAAYPAGFSALSPASMGTTLAPVTFPIPSGLSFSYDFANGSHKLSWTATEGATSYTVYRDTVYNGAYLMQFIAGSSTNYVDSTGTDFAYYYKVSANYAGGTSGLSGEVSSLVGESWTSAPVAYPTMKIATPVSYLGNGSHQFGSTNVWGGTYLLNTAGSPDTLSMTAPTSGTYIWNLTSRTSMYLTNSGYTGSTMTRQPPPAPEPPAALAASNWTATSVSISWEESEGATSYLVYRDVSSTGTFTTAVYSGSTTSYTDSLPSAGTVYYYKVTASNSGGESTKSIEISSLSGTTWKSGVSGSTPSNLGAITYIGNNDYTVGGGTIFAGTYHLDTTVTPNTLTMTIPSNPNYTGFNWRVNNLVSLYLTGPNYVGATMAR